MAHAQGPELPPARGVTRGGLKTPTNAEIGFPVPSNPANGW